MLPWTDEKVRLDLFMGLCICWKSSSAMRLSVLKRTVRQVKESPCTWKAQNKHAYTFKSKDHLSLWLSLFLDSLDFWCNINLGLWCNYQDWFLSFSFLWVIVLIRNPIDFYKMILYLLTVADRSCIISRHSLLESFGFSITCHLQVVKIWLLSYQFVYLLLLCIVWLMGLRFPVWCEITVVKVGISFSSRK